MRGVSRALLVFGLVGVVISGCVSVAPSGSTAPPTRAPATAGAPGGQPTLPPLPTFELPTLPPLPTFELPTIELPTFPSATTAAPGTTAPTSLPSGEPTVIVAVGDRTYEVLAEPNCNYGQLAADTWGMEYGNASAGPDELSSVRIIDAPDSTAAGERTVSIVIMVGSIFAGGSSYILQGDRFAQPPVEYELTEFPNGSVVAHARGTSMASPLSPGTATIDVTMRCSTVLR